ncbi:hypothetical protein KFE94_06145 [bacterium SCSIO 12643]|nr:hypothetical protein KFE94_06145 [bacterium SCSIO 12643]
MGTREKLFRQKLANQIETLLTQAEKVFTAEKLSAEWLNSMLTETQELNSALTIYKFLHELPEDADLQVKFLELEEEISEPVQSEVPNYGEEILKEIDEFESQEAVDVYETPAEDATTENSVEEDESIDISKPQNEPEIVVEITHEETASTIEVIVDDTDSAQGEEEEEEEEIILEETTSQVKEELPEEKPEELETVSEEIDATSEEEIKKEINDTVAQNHTSVADKLRANSIQKLAESIALNERFLFSNELFNGNMEAFKRALTELDHIASLSDAQRYINIQLKEENQWDMESETVEKFITLIKRRFI